MMGFITLGLFICWVVLGLGGIVFISAQIPVRTKNYNYDKSGS